jgi:hypothetical protein
LSSFGRQIDVDATNEEFYRALQDVPFRDVPRAGVAAHSRRLLAWGALEDPSSGAAWWDRKTVPDHYMEHLPRLREWVAGTAATAADRPKRSAPTRCRSALRKRRERV